MHLSARPAYLPPHRGRRFRLPAARAGRRVNSDGQSVTEFALVFPIMVVLLLAVIDFSRVYTTMMSVESAAREAADYGTMYGAGKWDVGAPLDANVAEMQRRACVAASDLPDYQDADNDPSNGCENPAFSYCVSPADGAACLPVNAADHCADPLRDPPCTVTVTLTYDFHLVAPVNIQLNNVTIGFPSTITIQRESTFAITDIDLSPTP
jgi:TadE-like protein